MLLFFGWRCDCQVRPAHLSLDKRIYLSLSLSLSLPPPPPWIEDIYVGSSGEAGINAEAGVGLEGLIKRRNSGYSLNYRAAASFQRDGAAEGRGEGRRLGGRWGSMLWHRARPGC